MAFHPPMRVASHRSALLHTITSYTISLQME